MKNENGGIINMLFSTMFLSQKLLTIESRFYIYILYKEITKIHQNKEVLILVLCT